MKKIGILTCSNTTQDLGCSSFKCLEELHKNEGKFKRYINSGGARLAGIINCAGCPTTVAPAKLVSRVRSLSAIGVDAIHLSGCMMALCPFKNKYIKLLGENFPEIEIIQGTHEAPDGGPEWFLAWANQTLSSLQNPMAELTKQVLSNQVVSYQNGENKPK